MATNKLTLREFAAVVANGATVYSLNGKVSARKQGPLITISGPSGTHMMAEAHTDLARFNAHWLTFCGHKANR